MSPTDHLFTYFRFSSWQSFWHSSHSCNTNFDSDRAWTDFSCAQRCMLIFRCMLRAERGNVGLCYLGDSIKTWSHLSMSLQAHIPAWSADSSRPTFTGDDSHHTQPQRCTTHAFSMHTVSETSTWKNACRHLFVRKTRKHTHTPFGLLWGQTNTIKLSILINLSALLLYIINISHELKSHKNGHPLT